MGSQTSIVQADASYAGADSSGTITFTPDPWHYDHAGGPILEMALNADEATSTVTATMTVTTWEVWTDGTNYEDRNITTGPAGGAYVTFAADGDVRLCMSKVFRCVRECGLFFRGLCFKQEARHYVISQIQDVAG